MQGGHAGHHIRFYISYNKRRCLAIEGLVNLTGDSGANSGPPGQCAKMSSAALWPPNVQGDIGTALADDLADTSVLHREERWEYNSHCLLGKEFRRHDNSDSEDRNLRDRDSLVNMRGTGSVLEKDTEGDCELSEDCKEKQWYFIREK